VPVRSPLRLVLPAASAALAVALILATVLGAWDGSSSRSTTQKGAPNGGFAGAAFPTGVRAPGFTLTDQHGHRVSLSAYRGRVVALAFLPVPFRGSTDCRSCVLVAQQVRGALDELGPRAGVRTIFVNANPAAPPARGGQLLFETSLNGRVEYLTGAAAQLRKVWRAYRVTPASAGRAASEAAITVLLIDRHGFERVGFGLEQITPEGLAHDIRLLEGA
jgi:protein SCO1